MVYWGRQECVQLLLALGADPHKETWYAVEVGGRKFPKGLTPIDMAV